MEDKVDAILAIEVCINYLAEATRWTALVIR